MSKKTFDQPQVNIGLIGHVDHGKTTLTRALSGKWTDEHSEELKRGISIKLGYADCTVYKGKTKDGKTLFCTSKEDPMLAGEPEFVRRISFVDAPGHETLMATMLSGAALMDGALLLVAANEKCPQPQTREHLTALDAVGAKNIVIVQNKIDLVSPEQAHANYEQIKAFVKGTVAENAPIIPISAHHTVNINALVEAIEEIIPTPEHDSDLPPRLLVARSFDINKPGTRPAKLRGGVIGGSLLQGELKVGDKITISPGAKLEKEGKTIYVDVEATVQALYFGTNTVQNAGPGGLVAIGTDLDPSITKADNLVGRMVGRTGEVPESLSKISMQVHLLERVVGTSDESMVEPLKVKEPLMLNAGTATTVGVVLRSSNNDVECALKLPIASLPGNRIAISRRVGGRWRLIGFGVLKE